MLDDVIAQVAEWQENANALEPSKLKLKESAWTEYDPCFTHVGEKTHQFALEMRPKKSNISRPMCPDFNSLPAHPAFVAVRTCTLSDPILLTLVRDLLYASMIDRVSAVGAGTMFLSSSVLPPSSHPQYPYLVLQKEWSLRCSGAVFSKTLQLLTLMVHNLVRPKNEPQSYSNGKISEGAKEYSPFCFVGGNADACSGEGGEDEEEGKRKGQTHVPSLRERQELFETFLLTPGSLVLSPATKGTREELFGRRNLGRVLKDITPTRTRTGSSSSSISSCSGENGDAGFGRGGFNTPSSSSSSSPRGEFGIPPPLVFDVFSSELELSSPQNVGVGGELGGEREHSIEEKVREGEKKEVEVCVPLPPLLNTIMDIYDSLSCTGSDDDIFNKQSLLWIIDKLENTLSPKCREVIENRMKQELHEKRRLEMKEKREKARDRAMNRMKKNAKAFMEHMEQEV